MTSEKRRPDKAQKDLESSAQVLTTEEARDLAAQGGMRPAFYAKCNVLNEAILEIGFGRYQWELFFTAGFGWMADNLCELPSRFGL